MGAASESSGRFALPRVLDHWYVACQSDDLKKEPRAFRLFGQRLVLFRDERGMATTLLDRCAHRNMPLRVGRVVEGHLECSYHGWRFNGAGQCTRIPALCGEHGGAARRVPSHATLEQQGLIWVYARADVSPNVSPYQVPLLDEESYHHVRYGYEFNATLYSTVENILDVPHTAFLHRGLFRGGTKNQIRVEVIRQSTEVCAQYIGEPAPRGLAGMLLAPRGGLVEHYDRFILPSVAQVEYRLSESSHLLITNLLTPHDDFQTGLLTIFSLRLPFGVAAVTPLLRPLALRIVQQDAHALALQTEAILEFGGEQFVSTAVDVLSSHILRLLRHAERGETCSEAREETVLLV